jgi:Tfp pilus assembly protein PilE
MNRKGYMLIETMVAMAVLISLGLLTSKAVHKAIVEVPRMQRISNADDQLTAFAKFIRKDIESASKLSADIPNSLQLESAKGSIAYSIVDNTITRTLSGQQKQWHISHSKINFNLIMHEQTPAGVEIKTSVLIRKDGKVYEKLQRSRVFFAMQKTSKEQL